VLTPEHIVAKAITLGRPKDIARVQAFLAERAVDLAKLKSLLERFNLMPSWSAFCFKAGRQNPFDVS
jgi:hypothetical protein